MINKHRQLMTKSVIRLGDAYVIGFCEKCQEGREIQNSALCPVCLDPLTVHTVEIMEEE